MTLKSDRDRSGSPRLPRTKRSKMRKKLYRNAVQTMVSDQTYDRLWVIANKNNMSMSELTRDIYDQYLTNQEDKT